MKDNHSAEQSMRICRYRDTLAALKRLTLDDCRSIYANMDALINIMDSMAQAIESWDREEERRKLLPVLESGLNSEEADLCAAGDHVNAIKAVKMRLDIGLKDAKDMVDRHRGVAKGR